MAITSKSLLPALASRILREGRRQPLLNPGLFSAVFALAVANATVSLLAYSKIVLPIATRTGHDFNALWDAVPASSSDHGELVEDMARSVLELIPATATYAAVTAVVGSVSWVVAVFAAVGAFSGKAPNTFGERLSRARSPLMAAAVANFAASAFVGAIAALALATVFLEELLPALVLVDMLLGLAAYAAHRCVDFVCAVGVVVAAEEPGCGVAAALRRAWRLTAVEPAEAVLFVLAMPAVAGAASPFFVVAAASAPSSVPWAWHALLGLVYVLCSGAAQVVSACAVTVFYHEYRLRCKEADSQHSDEPDV